jgi:cell division protein FtsB
VRILSFVLLALLVLVQFPLWLGKGGWLRVWDLERQVALQQASNERLLERNRSLEGEVKDLRDGVGAIEERARYELGMMRSEEIFVQLPERRTTEGAAQAQAPRVEAPAILAARETQAPRRSEALSAGSEARAASTANR